MFAIAAWSDARRPLRVAALLADRSRLVDSDAETLRALAAAIGSRDVLTHARWVEILGRDALSLRFYRTLERTIAAIAASAPTGSDEARAEVALLHASRLLFLAFLEAKGWLDDDRSFLSHAFDRCMADGGRFHDRVLRPLFFGTLNTPIGRRAPAARAFGSIPFLNGGLFARTPLERRSRGLSFGDDAYGALIYDLFGQYRFTAREESASWSEAAVDPEMLGRAFESLMASRERRRTGAFFTPFPLVERVTNAGLDALLGDAVSRPAIERLTVLDPACGSGAFLVYALERLAGLLAALGDDRDLGTIRRDVLTRSIFGVDMNPTAVWLCELRLWLSVVIESEATDPAAVMPLPNLDRNIRAGDALSGQAFHDGRRPRGGLAFARLRERYARATGKRKESLSHVLEHSERQQAIAAIDDELASIGQRRRDLLDALRGRDLFGDRVPVSREARVGAVALRRRASALRATRRRIAAGGALPFAFPAHFADIAARGGFALVIGNPPWIRIHRLSAAERVTVRRDFEVARAPAWEDGAAAAGAGPGFAAQIDVAALFIERSVWLLAPQGVFALLVPVKLWRSLAGGGVRRLVAREVTLARIEDHSEGTHAFDAAVYPSLVVARKALIPSGGGESAHGVHVAVHRHGQTPFTWRASWTTVPFDETPGAPWILLPPDARIAFDRLRDIAMPLARTVIGRPHLGVKCGCNAAFIVELLDADGGLAEVETATKQRITIERALVRPLVRGEHLARWRTADRRQCIIWTHDDRDAPLAELPPHAARWLTRWRRALTARTDARHGTRWWALFRIESAHRDRPRVVWGDLGREPRASVLDVGDTTVPLNSCYVARCPSDPDGHAFAALLNGPLARAWLDVVSEPARGGYHRYFGWTLSLLPMPRDWDRARAILAPIGERARRGHAPSDVELFEASADAYGVARELVAPLVAWAAC
jgi:hypothetical protein